MALTSRWRGEPRRDLGGAAGDEVDDAAGDVGGGQRLGQRDRRQRAQLAGQHDGGVAGDDHRRQHRDRPSSEERCGARTATTPVGSGAEMSKYGPGHRVEPTEDLGELVGPARHTRPSGRWPARRSSRPALGDALAGAHLGDELGATPLHHLGDAVEHLTAVVCRGAGPARRTRCGRRRPRRGRPCASPWAALARNATAAVDDLVGAARLRAGELARRCRACRSCARRRGPAGRAAGGGAHLVSPVVT